MKRVSFFLIVFSFIVAFAIVAFFLSMQITSTPRFCGTCHIMRPYYESWKRSTHNEVPCVECHIPPGIVSEMRKKYEALAMVARYITGTYSTNPWTEIEDDACLRCHEKKLLAGKVVFKNILFDHTPHLVGLRGGKELRCTSCHSQRVQGVHIKVTETTCFLCHFKGVKIGEEVSDCKLCHGTPEKKVVSEGFEFDHKDVEKHKMNCLFCHSHSIEGKGNVPKERCYSCHNVSERLKKYGKPRLLHQIHITEHKVECISCHLEIYHGKPRDIEAVVKTPCSTCHTAGHSPQKDLYMGIGGKGVPPMPSAMFKVGIKCEGCHFMKSDGVKTSGAFSCMNCHGASYYKIYKMWDKSMDDKLNKTKKILDQARNLLPENTKELKDAIFNLKLVERGYGIHNIDYSSLLLEKAIEFINGALEKKKVKKTFEIPWVRYNPKKRVCLRCHQGIENKKELVFGISFDHKTHIVKEQFNCTQCHRPHYEKPRGEVLKFGKKGCVPCHHKKEIKRTCTSCHKNIYNMTLRTKLGDFSHKFHIEEVDLKCVNCHKKGKVNFEVCEDCHN